MSRKPARIFMSIAPHLLLLPIAIIALLPLFWLLISSLKTQEDFFATLFFPENATGGIAWGKLTFRHYISLYEEGFFLALANSLFLAGTVATVSALATAAGGYALARLRSKITGPVLWVAIATLVIPPPLLLAPSYEFFYDIGLLDSYLSIILPAAAPAFGVFLFRQYSLQAVPPELLEAARIDGLGEVRIFTDIALPLLKPMTAGFMILAFLTTWNSFILPQVFLQDENKMPLAVAISNLRGVYYTDYGLQMAATIVAIVPPIAMFLLFQRDFVSGLSAGAVKG